jgi:hypothetical protein
LEDAEIRRIAVSGQLRQNVFKIPSHGKKLSMMTCACYPSDRGKLKNRRQSRLAKNDTLPPKYPEGISC